MGEVSIKEVDILTVSCRLEITFVSEGKKSHTMDIIPGIIAYCLRKNRDKEKKMSVM